MQRSARGATYRQRSNHWALDRILRSKILGRGLKIRIYRTILRVVLYGSETWTLTQKDEQMLSICEGMDLRSIFGPVRVCNVHSKRSIVVVAKTNRLRWTGHIEMMDGSRQDKIIAEASKYRNQRRGKLKKKI